MTVCIHCGLHGHAKPDCPDRKVLRIPAFLDTDPIPFVVTMPAMEDGCGNLATVANPGPVADWLPSST